jgi:sugar phosphate isomerase/epimerase
VAQYEPLHTNINGVITDAHALGALAVIFPWIPHQKAFTESECRQGCLEMNRWGGVLKQAGLEFWYHPHGYEFRPSQQGTLFDLMVALTDPAKVNFQADVFWIAWPGQDPVALLRKYPTRFVSMHLKDMRKGTKLGDSSGRAPADASVPVGSGMLDFPAVLREGKKIGIKWYYIEDEALEAAENIPISLRYLRTLGMSPT